MLTGSLCLSDIPREVMKKIVCKDGKERVYVNFAIIECKNPQVFNGRTFTHFMSVAPKKEDRKEGVNYIVANLETFNPQPSAPTVEQIQAAPSVSPDDDLPF